MLITESCQITLMIEKALLYGLNIYKPTKEKQKDFQAITWKIFMVTPFGLLGWFNLA